MKLSDDLLNDLRNVLEKTQKNPVNGSKLQDWRIFLSRTQMITLGIKNNIGGSVYKPPAYKSAENAEVYLVWEDGKCSRGKVQKPAAGQEFDWNRQLLLWNMAAFEDPYAIKIPSPAKLPKVRIAAEEIYDLITNDNSPIFDQQAKILANRPRGVQTGANMMAYWGRNFIYTSTGIQIDYDESRYAVSWSFDSQISEGFAKRRTITESEWEGLWKDSLAKYELIRNQGEPVHRKSVVILAPDVIEQMIGQYILPNFRGENILEGQSYFSMEEFTNETHSFDQGLCIEINPLEPYTWESYLLTNEGIPAVRTVLVSNGKLQSPYLNVKDALRWNLAPTAIPFGASGITINHHEQVDWLDMLEGIDDGILILSVLGLHTQNSVTGNFSLTGPSSLRIKNGRLRGKVDVRINGNLWDVLSSPHTSYARCPLYKHPFLLAPCEAENL